MQMIQEALEHGELEKVRKADELKAAGNRHERRAEEARKRALDKMVAELQAAGRERNGP